jgi:hypothetical protein
VDAVLGFFGKSVSSARRQHRHFVEQGIALGKRPQLTGGGLIRSLGGWGAVKAMRQGRVHVKSDERILGDSDFANRYYPRKRNTWRPVIGSTLRATISDIPLGG